MRKVLSLVTLFTLFIGQSFGQCEAYFVAIAGENGYYSFDNNSVSNNMENTIFLWQFGDGTIADGALPSHQYEQSGAYEVCLFLTVLDGNMETCGDTYCTTIEVTVTSNCPDAISSVAGENCGDMNFEIGSFVEGEAVNWFPGDDTGMVEGGHFFSHSYAEPGEYTVCAFYTSPACPNGAELCTNIVVESCNTECPTAIVADMIDCDSYVFSIANAPVGNVSWDFGDGVTESASTTADHSYAENGVYIVTAEYSGPGCPNGVTLIFTVNVECETQNECPENIFVEYIEDFCYEIGFQVGQPNDNAVVDWYFENETVNDFGDFIWMGFNEGDAGMNSVCAFYTSPACPNGTELCVEFFVCTPETACPDAIWNGPGQQCGMMLFEIGSFVEGEEVTWFPGDETGAVQGGHFFEHMYAAPGEYQVCAFYTSPLCPNGVELCTNIVVEFCETECPSIINGQALDCNSYIFNIVGAETGNVIWDFGDGSEETSSVFADHSYAENGVYVITAHYSGPGCPNGININYTIIVDCEIETNCPSEIWSGPGVDCGVMNFEIGSFVEGEAVTWFPGDETGAVETGHFFSHTYAQPGSYTVCAFYTSPACPNGVELCTNIVVESCNNCPTTIVYDYNCPDGTIAFYVANWPELAPINWVYNGESISSDNNFIVLEIVEGPGYICAFSPGMDEEGCNQVCLEMNFQCNEDDCPTEIWSGAGEDCGVMNFEIGSFVQGEAVTWYPGDETGAVETGHFFSHIYEEPGTYNVCAFYTSSICPDGVELCTTIVVEACETNCTEVNLALDSFVGEGGPTAAYWWLMNSDDVTINQGIGQYNENDPYYESVFCLEDGCYTLMVEGLNVANALDIIIQISGESIIQSIEVSNDNLVFVHFGVNSDCVESACEASFEPIFTNTPGHIEFQNTSTYDGAAEWHWDYGNGVTSDGQGGNIWYETNGVYVVCLTITTAGCTDTYCETIAVTNMETGCELNEVTITITSEYANENTYDMIELLFNVNDITIDGIDIAAIEGTITLAGCIPDGCYQITAQAPDGMEITADAISITVDAVEASVLLGLNVENNSVSAELGINSDCTDSVNENTIAQFSMYPNPANEIFTVRSGDNQQIDRMEIMDASGRMILSASQTSSMNVGGLASGCYFVRVTSAQNTAVLPLNIQH